jgi:alpha-glucosidase
MTLNLSLSGQPFNGPDIGGFDGNASPGLFGHWISLGAFYPFCRAHTAVNTADQEPWEFGKEVEVAARTALSKRYRLLPYLYTLFREASETGMPVMRPAFFADPVDPRLRREEEAFLVGNSLLVIPEWADDPAIPDRIWRKLEIDIPGIDGEVSFQPELRIRGGSIIPAGPAVESTRGYRLDPLTLFVCPDGEGKAEGILYEDEYDGYRYLDGEYLLTGFSAITENGAVTVSAEKISGSMSRPERELRVVLVTGKGVYRAGGIGGEAVTVTVD